MVTFSVGYQQTIAIGLPYQGIRCGDIMPSGQVNHAQIV